MPLPVRSLPTVQNWDCRSCTDCCRSFVVQVSVAEEARIRSQAKWKDDPALKGVDLIVFDKVAGVRRLAHTADGACVFLGENGKCRIHAEYGAAAKPTACRIYPFTLMPAGDHWRVGVRYACPAAARNDGRPLTAHAPELAEYAALLEADSPVVRSLPPPSLQPGQQAEWPDVLRFAKAVGKIVGDGGRPIERRLREVAALMATCKAAKFDKVTGGRLAEFLNVMAATTADEVPADPYSVPPPSWVARSLFRQVLAVYSRADQGPDAGTAARTGAGRFKAAWRFARSRGPIPKLSNAIPDAATFEAAEQPAGELPPEADALLTRYYAVKVQSMQFCGPGNFGRTLWDGLASLLLTYPAILWLARVLASGGTDRVAAISKAVQMVDNNFGFNKLLGGRRMTWMNRTLADRGEVAQLIAWYSR